MKISRFLAAAFLLAVCTPAFAQWQTPDRSVPLGRGAGNTGFRNVAPGTNGQALAGNTGADPSFQHTATVLNAACTLAPAACVSMFGYVNPLWYGATCNGSTDDTAAFATAITAANRKVLRLPAGATCVVRYFEICTDATCQTGRAGGSVPLMIEGDGATLTAPASAVGAQTFVYVELNSGTQYGNNIWNFAIRNLTINGGNFVNRGLTVVGCLYCTFENIGESNAQVIGCHFSAMPNYLFANNLIQRVQCNFNNTNSGTTGYGLYENTSAAWLGPDNCAVVYNAGNTFVATHTLFNGKIGWLAGCANNSHINPDMEMNLDYGLSVSNVVASEWIGAQFSSNKNARAAAGTGGDASVLNGDSSPGLQFFGGASDGTFTNVSGANNNTLAMRGIAGFGFTANCNASGRYCMTLP